MNLLTLPITTALTGVVPGAIAKLPAAPRNLVVQGNFTYGSGGTSADAYLQTSVDDGVTWTDVANFHFLVASARFIYNLNGQTPNTTQVTPTDGALGANTAKDGILGPLFRVKVTTVGTYAGTTLLIDIATDNTRVI